jgi:hypothetical protein
MNMIDETVCGRLFPTATGTLSQLLNNKIKRNETSYNTTSNLVPSLNTLFPSCQEQVLFTWLPCLGLALPAPFWLHMLLAHAKFNNIKVTWLTVSKTVTIGLLILNQLTHMANLLSSSSTTSSYISVVISLELISATLLALTFVSAT